MAPAVLTSGQVPFQKTPVLTEARSSPQSCWSQDDFMKQIEIIGYPKELLFMWVVFDAIYCKTEKNLNVYQFALKIGIINPFHMNIDFIFQERNSIFQVK